MPFQEFKIHLANNSSLSQFFQFFQLQWFGCFLENSRFTFVLIWSVLIIFRKESLLFDVLCLFRKGRAPVEDFQIPFCPDLSTSSGCSNSAKYSQRDGCLLENTIWFYVFFLLIVTGAGVPFTEFQTRFCSRYDTFIKRDGAFWWVP